MEALLKGEGVIIIMCDDTFIRSAAAIASRKVSLLSIFVCGV